MNMVSESIVDRFAFKIESHPHPFKIDWVYKTLLPVKKRYLITLRYDYILRISIMRYYL